MSEKYSGYATKDIGLLINHYTKLSSSDPDTHESVNVYKPLINELQKEFHTRIQKIKTPTRGGGAKVQKITQNQTSSSPTSKNEIKSKASSQIKSVASIYHCTTKFRRMDF